MKVPSSIDQIWECERGDGPLLVTALHDSHLIRSEAEPYLQVSSDERLREEDPYTRRWTGFATTRVVVTRSRFEVDLNRPEERALYRTPQEAWGLRVWREETPENVLEGSLAQRRLFYQEMEGLLSDLVSRHPIVVLIDLHTYNHRREGPAAPEADPAWNPQVDIGTSAENRPQFVPLIERFMGDLRKFDFLGARLDVRENVKFPLGPFGEWAQGKFPGRVCALGIEVKKFFMDEWTGEADETLLEAIGEALASTVPGLMEEVLRIPQFLPNPGQPPAAPRVAQRQRDSHDS